VTWPQIVELRQYTLRPGRRDELIDLFEAEFVESQAASGIALLGTFRDLDDPCRFSWLRGFETSDQRASALADFYGGPIWKSHREAANATMVDSDNVLLLRPVTVPTEASLHVGLARSGDRGTVEVMLLPLSSPADDAAVLELVPRDPPILGVFVTSSEANTFPALPVREGEHFLVWATGYSSRAEYDGAWQQRARMLERVTAIPGLVGAPQVLQLDPTARTTVTVR
jgi:hypothetical protein